ncbi:MAG: hypothetical protein U0N20_03570 [Clostridium sp.]
MKKIFLSFLCCLFLVSGCSSQEQEPGKILEIGIEDAFSKMDNKDTFLLLVSRDKCYYCQLMEKMLDETIEDHPTVIYNVKMDDSTTDKLYADHDLLKTRLEKPGTTPHVYYIKDGEVEADMTGFDESEPELFWDWVEENGIENLQ